MTTRFAFFVTISLLLLAPKLLAKGKTVKVVIAGGDLAKPVEISDPNTLVKFQVWAGLGTSSNHSQGFIVDWSGGVIKESPKGLTCYEVSFYVNEPEERIAYVVLYAFDPTGRGYVYIPGKSDPQFEANVRTIYRGVEGNWFHAWTVWDSLAEPLINHARPSVRAAPVRAQVATIRPFVAIMIEAVAPRPGQPPIPITRLETIAVRSDGSVSRVTKWDVRPPTQAIYWRDVFDATAKTRAEVEDTTRTIIKRDYSDLQILKPGVLCDGKPAGQIDGLDVLYSEQPRETTELATSIMHKQWVAPELGCYPVKQEWVGKIQGTAMDTTQTLASIHFGEPNPWYFSIPADYATRTADEWMQLAKPLLKQ